VITDDLAEFAGRLRDAGMAVAVPRIAAAAEALIMTPWLALPTPYWPLRLTLCGKRSDLAIFDAVYAGWEQTTGDDVLVETEAAVAVPERAAESNIEPDAASVTGTGGAAFSGPLAGRDLRTLSDAERAYVADLITQLKPSAGSKRVARRVRARSGRVDAARTVRLMIHNRGEPTRLQRWRHDQRPRRLLFLIDVSKSMMPYVDMFLLYAHAALMAGPRTVEVFTIGTRWTRVTAELIARDPQDAMRAISEIGSDWSQGTQLGRSLESFLRRWSGHRAVRSAVVVICTDGHENSRDPYLLPRQVARLSRIAHRLIWINPAARRLGYRPMPILADCLRYADAELTGHTLGEIYTLTEAITR